MTEVSVADGAGRGARVVALFARSGRVVRVPDEDAAADRAGALVGRRGVIRGATTAGLGTSGDTAGDATGTATVDDSVGRAAVTPAEAAGAAAATDTGVTVVAAFKARSRALSAYSAPVAMIIMPSTASGPRTATMRSSP